jgi:predicted SAM-dependent methyltransferase
MKVLIPGGSSAEWDQLTTVDIDPNCGADIVMDLDASYGWDRLPSERYDEVHAYEVLEHLGSLGDAARFFAHFGEIYRLLKPGGFLCATVPSRHGPWLWGDPGHRRAITRESLAFLSQLTYAQVGTTTMTDYRTCWRGDFDLVYHHDDRVTFGFVLQAIKPARGT